MSSTSSVRDSSAPVPKEKESERESQATLLEEWRAAMDEKDRVIHDLAAKMLESRYCPERSNSFIEFMKCRKKP